MRLPDLIQIGEVSSVDYKAGTVKVLMSDVTDTVTTDLPVLNHEYLMPNIGDTVLCVFLTNGPSYGICLGGYFQDETPPTVWGKGMYYKALPDGAFIKYDTDTKTLTLSAEHVVIEQTGGV
jgi:phage baseplate assembly protein V